MPQHGVHLPAVERERLGRQAVILRETGYTFDEIAADLDVSQSTARNLVALGRRLAPNPSHLKGISE